MMTIEELKGLKEWFHLVTGHLPSAMNATFCYMIDALIDAEIERQSVTDEEIQDAVRTFQEFLADACNYNWVDYTDESDRLEASARIAIDALRAYRKPTESEVSDD